MRHIISTVKTD